MATDIRTAQVRRGGENRVIGSSGKPLLVIVEGSNIDAMVDAGIGAIGGLGRIIGDHKAVLLKPNTNQRDPFPSTTSAEHIRAVARHCGDAGATSIAVHEDHRPAGGQEDLKMYYEAGDLPGMDIRFSRAGASEDYVLVEHEPWSSEAKPSDVPQGDGASWASRMLDADYEQGATLGLRVAREVQEAPVVINLPVLKRHFAGQITSAIKNHVGSVYGMHRWIAHAMMQSERDYFDRKLVEFASAVRPELTITDIRSIQAVSGPMVGDDTTFVHGVNRLIVTGDTVAADVVAMDIMKRHDVTFTTHSEAIVNRQHAYAEELGLGMSDLSKFEVIELTV